jgi:hypothetical protein
MTACERGWSVTLAARCLPSGVENEVAAMRAPWASRTKNTISADVAAFTSCASSESTTFVTISAPLGALPGTAMGTATAWKRSESRDTPKPLVTCPWSAPATSGTPLSSVP